MEVDSLRPNVEESSLTFLDPEVYRQAVKPGNISFDCIGANVWCWIVRGSYGNDFFQA